MNIKNRKKSCIAKKQLIFVVLLIFWLSSTSSKAWLPQNCNNTVNCPIAQSGCLLGGGCGAGNYHKEIQLRISYPVCGLALWGSCDNDTVYKCLEILVYTDSNCMYQYAILCYTIGYGC